jgi:hypothetical protein
MPEVRTRARGVVIKWRTRYSVCITSQPALEAQDSTRYGGPPVRIGKVERIIEVPEPADLPAYAPVPDPQPHLPMAPEPLRRPDSEVPA